MNVDLKPLSEQTIVITGASSGIGLATARLAAERGARVVLVARGEDALEELEDELAQEGAEAVAVPADVTDRDQVREVVETATETYGGFDTWVNGAGVFIYGRLDETPIEDMRAQFEVNVWGLLYGSLAAAEHLREGDGGAIVNVGSTVSDRAIPLQGSYSASKHAVKGFTDALRMELEEEGAPVSVTLVKPGAMDTPYPEHAENYMDEEADLPAPVYEPETAARSILHAAEHPERDVTVGAGGEAISLLGRLTPGLADRVMESSMFDQQRTDRPPQTPEESGLDGPVGELEERGDYEGHVASSSLYTRAALHPKLTAAAVAGLAAVAGTLYARSRSDRDERERERRRRTADPEERRGVRERLREAPGVR